MPWLAALSLCPWLGVERVGDNVVARTDLGRSGRVLLAGHLDTVPPVDGNGEEPRIEGDTVYGVGAADMKGGLRPPYSSIWPARLPSRPWMSPGASMPARRWNSGSTGCTTCGTRQCPILLQADAAILGEGTAGIVEAGCRDAAHPHPALAGLPGPHRPPGHDKNGHNAIHRLAPIAGGRGRGARAGVPMLDGCEVRRAAPGGGSRRGSGPQRGARPRLGATSTTGSPPIARWRRRNRRSARLLGAHLEPEGQLGIWSSSHRAPPGPGPPDPGRTGGGHRCCPGGQAGMDRRGLVLAHGIPAANFGPGDPLLAHTPGEHVSRGQLERAATVLGTVLAAGDSAWSPGRGPPLPTGGGSESAQDGDHLAVDGDLARLELHGGQPLVGRGEDHLARPGGWRSA